MTATTPFNYAIYFIASMFGLIMIFSVWGMVFDVHLVPVLITQVNSTSANIPEATQVTIQTAYSYYMVVFRYIFYIMFGVGTLLFLVHIVMSEKEEVYVQPPQPPGVF